MADTIHQLAVELSLSAPSLASAAQAAMSAFAGVESAAVRAERAVMGMRLTMQTQGLNASAQEAMGIFRGLELQSGKLGDTFRGMNLSLGTAPLIASVADAEQGLARLQREAKMSVTGLGQLGSSLSAGTQPFVTGIAAAETRLAGFQREAQTARTHVERLSDSLSRMQQVSGLVPGNRLYDYTQAQLTGRQSQLSGLAPAIAASEADLAAQRAALTAHHATLLGTAQADLAAQQAALDSHLTSQMAAVSAAGAAEQKRMQSGVNKMMVGGALTIGGGMTLGLLGKLAQKGAGLQTQMEAVQIATGASPDQMATLQQKAIAVGATNQMSVTDVARLMAAEVGAGLTLGAKAAGMTPEQMVERMTPALANLGEVLQMTKGMRPDQSASVGVQFAHVFGAMTPDAMEKMTNTLGRALFVTPSTPSELLDLVSQFAPATKELYGMNAPGLTAGERKRRTDLWVSDSLQTGVLESILGQQTRGGTQIGAIITRGMGIPTSRRNQQQIRADREIERIAGSTFADPRTGQFLGTAHAMQMMAAVAMKEPDPRVTAALFQVAFGRVGARQASLLGDPTTINAFKTIGMQLGANYGKDGALPSLASIQQQYNQTEQGQMNQARKNFETLQAVVGVQLIPAMTALARVAGSVAGSLTHFATEQPGMTKAIVAITAVGAAASLIAGPILLIAGALSVLGPAVLGIGAAFTLVTGVALGPLLLIGVALAGTIFIITHWGETLRFVGGIFSGLGTAMSGLLDWMRKNIPGLAGATDALGAGATGAAGAIGGNSSGGMSLSDINHGGRGRRTANGLPPGAPGALGASYSVLNTRMDAHGKPEMVTAPPQLASIYAAAAKKSGVPLNVLLAQGARESDFLNIRQKGGAGVGIAQWDFSTPDNIKNAMGYLHAATLMQAQLFAMDPSKAIPAQAAYVAHLIKTHGDNVQAGLAAYNGSGPAARLYGQQVMAAARSVVVHPGAVVNHITVHAAPGQSAKEIALQVVQTAEDHMLRGILGFTAHGALGGQQTLNLSPHGPGPR